MVILGRFVLWDPLARVQSSQMPCRGLTADRGRRGQSQIESGEESNKASHSKLRQDSDGRRSRRRRIPCLLDLQ